MHFDHKNLTEGFTAYWNHFPKMLGQNWLDELAQFDPILEEMEERKENTAPMGGFFYQANLWRKFEPTDALGWTGKLIWSLWIPIILAIKATGIVFKFGLWSLGLFFAVGFLLLGSIRFDTQDTNQEAGTPA